MNTSTMDCIVEVTNERTAAETLMGWAEREPAEIMNAWTECRLAQV
jgi:hypothetical protein